MSISRRKFLSNSAVAATAGLSALDAFAKPVPSNQQHAGWSLKIMATNWGFAGSVDEFCSRAKKQGYDGFELWVPGDEKGRAALKEAATKHQLSIGLLCGGSDRDFTKHFEQFKAAATEAVKIKPVYVNCHSGKDHFSFDQNRKLMDFTGELSAQSGVPVYHETHRGRALFAAHITKEFIQKIPSLRLTLDVSHWCNVHESLLEDQAETMELALGRAEHIHARIGHAEGPQVNDPRAPEWLAAVNAHFAWWDKIVERKKKEEKTITILTEFGPADYMPTLPYTRQPLSDQWEINAYMMQVLRKRYLP
jgi:sugar phosphate isomerase/epimerase